jgi:hypothetical protein
MVHKSIKYKVLIFLIAIAGMVQQAQAKEAQVCFAGVEDENGQMVSMSHYENWYDQQYKMYEMSNGLSCEKLQSYKELTNGVAESLEVVESVIKNNQKWMVVRLIVTTIKMGTRVLNVYLADLPCDKETAEKVVTEAICTSEQLASVNIKCRNVNSSNDVLDMSWLNGTESQNMCVPQGSYDL